MQLLPDREQGRPLAIGLLVVAIIVVYLVGFHWFVMRHVGLGNEIGELEQQIARFKATAGQRESLENRLQVLQAERMGNTLFLPGQDFSIAAAGMIRMLRDWIDSNASDAELCSVSNTAPQRARDPELFEAVRVDVRMSCPLGDFVKVLHELETSVPLIFVENLRINQRFRPDQRRNQRSRSTYGLLDIQFQMLGYIDQPGLSEEEV
ncbi:MAG: type II secretion system protein GspM [Pseudomonadota bacterium]